jgi:hypothetical protein
MVGQGQIDVAEFGGHNARDSETGEGKWEWEMEKRGRRKGKEKKLETFQETDRLGMVDIFGSRCILNFEP